MHAILEKNEVTVVENKNIIIKKFESDAEYIFGNQILGKKYFLPIMQND
ncbi:hypothetical protein MKR65_07375 [Acinetobacter baumannii]